MADPYRTAPSAHTWHVTLTARSRHATGYRWLDVIELQRAVEADDETRAIQQAADHFEDLGYDVLACVEATRVADVP